jgi:peptidoglycan/xylan/chitin deacetylase (PgdA/CDA1 family)
MNANPLRLVSALTLALTVWADTASGLDPAPRAVHPGVPQVEPPSAGGDTAPPALELKLLSDLPPLPQATAGQIHGSGQGRGPEPESSPGPNGPAAVPPRPPGAAEKTGPGSEAMLGACWTPAQLVGTEEERLIMHHLKGDAGPPPPWAVDEARLAAVPLPEDLRGSIRGVEPTNPKAHLIALAFDLCEQAGERAGYDGRVVDWLRANGVKATFFAGGKWLRTHQERAMQLMADPLFEVGNHGWTHENLRVVQGKEARDQILWSQAEYGAVREGLLAQPCAAGLPAAERGRIPAWPKVFRFPYGACDAASLGLTADLGLPAIQWTLVTGDPDRSRSAQAIAEGVLEGVRHRRGVVLVAHANGRGWHTAESLPLFVPKLRAQGWRFVTVSELLAAGRPISVDSCYELKPGDNLRYDHPAASHEGSSGDRMILK